MSGLPIENIERKFVTASFRGKKKFEIRVATIGKWSSKLALVLCHDYMQAGCIQWYSYVKPLSEHFRLIIPDIGTYGANSRIDHLEGNALQSPQESESFILEWFSQWITAMGSDLPEKFHIAGFANGGFQAGLFASKMPQRIEKLLLLTPS